MPHFVVRYLLNTLSVSPLVSLLELVDHVLEYTNHQLFFGLLLDATLQNLEGMLRYDLLDLHLVILGAIDVHSSWLLQQRVLLQLVDIRCYISVRDLV